MIFHMLEVPVWANRLVIIVLALGFPVAMIFAWVYEMTPEGLQPTVAVPQNQSIRTQTGRRLDRAIIAMWDVIAVKSIGCEHRGDHAGHQQRDEHGRGNCKAELPEVLPADTAHEAHGQKHCDDGE